MGRFIREAGGKWNQQKKLWEISYSSIKSLELEERMPVPP
jgi:hypothetical protein